MSAAPSANYTPGSVLAIAQTIIPNSFEEKVAHDVAVCASSGVKVSIAYHTFGSTEDPMLLLIPGLNAQSVVNYDSATCTWLAQQGFYVVRMDNRDVGLSTKFDDVPQRIFVPGLMLPNWMAFGEVVPYTLNDMADDAAALIRKLLPSGQTAAHVVGVSMGGMIAQCLALRHGAIVRSLTLVMTNSGNSSVGQPSLATLIGFLHKPKSDSVEDMNEFRRWFVQNYLVGVPMVDTSLLDLVCKEAGRASYVKGAPRQMAAIQRAPCRDSALLKAFGARVGDGTPTVLPIHIVHGAKDRIVPVANGYHLHALMPRSKLSVFPDLGHYFDAEHGQEPLDAMVAFMKEH